MSCSAACDRVVHGRGIGWDGQGENKNCSLPMIPETSIHHLTLMTRKSNSATGGRDDRFSAHHRNSVKPLAWQPTDLRSPSIVCLIDYFPCNYSPCHTQYFTAPEKVQEGRFLWRTTFILSHLWATNVDREEAQVTLRSCTGHQWWFVWFDGCVILLCGRDIETVRASGWVFMQTEKQI